MEPERGKDVEIGPVVEKNSRPENIAIGGKILAGGGGEVEKLEPSCRLCGLV